MVVVYLLFMLLMFKFEFGVLVAALIVWVGFWFRLDILGDWLVVNSVV